MHSSERPTYGMHGDVLISAGQRPYTE